MLIFPDYSHFTTQIESTTKKLNAALLAKEYEEASYLAKELATLASGVALWVIAYTEDIKREKDLERFDTFLADWNQKFQVRE